MSETIQARHQVAKIQRGGEEKIDDDKEWLINSDRDKTITD